MSTKEGYLRAPWSVSSYDCLYICAIKDRDGAGIVEMIWHFDGDAIVEGEELTEDDRQTLRVANLIAAAPEMYEALEWIIYVASGVSKGSGEPSNQEYIDALNSGKAALAKANSVAFSHDPSFKL